MSGDSPRTWPNRRLVAGQRDHAEVGVVAPKAGNSRDAVQKRHMQVDHHGVRFQLFGLLDRLEPVLGRGDDLELGLPLDQLPQRLDEHAVVVCE
jgi:hypothetical protein